MRLALLLLALAACATAPPPGLHVEMVPLEAPQRGVAWREDAEAALAEAFSKRRGALVYFVVPGEEACIRMDRETMSQPRVRGLWTRMAAIRVNIDLTARRDLVGTYAPVGEVPSFALFGPDGSVVDRWSGYAKADAFRARVDESLRASVISPRWRDAWSEAMKRLRDDDLDPLRELVTKLEREGARGWAARLALAECRDRFYRYRWAGVVASTDLFLKRFPDHPAARELADLRARALFRGTGEREPGLPDRVAQHLDDLGESAPIFGGAEARAKWEQQRRATEDRLVAIGEPGADALLAAILDRQGSIAEPCARALGRIRYSRLMPDVIDALQNRSLRFPVRARMVSVMNAWADPGFLAPLIEVLGNTNEAAAVRIAAAAAVARLGTSHGGLYGPLVVAPVMSGLKSRSVDLRRETLGVLDSVSQAFDMDDLYSVMKDRRLSGVDDKRISDLACSLFLRRAGARLVGEDGKPLEQYPREAPAAIRHWWEANQHRLRWEETRRRYVSGKQ